MINIKEDFVTEINPLYRYLGMCQLVSFSFRKISATQYPITSNGKA